MADPEKTHTLITKGMEEAGDALTIERWQGASVSNESMYDIENASDIALFPVISLATSIACVSNHLPEPPQDLRATPKIRPGSRKVQSEVEVTWSVLSANLFDDSRHAYIFYSARRYDPRLDVVLQHTDNETGVFLPIIPSKESIRLDRAKITDRTISDYGKYHVES